MIDIVLHGSGFGPFIVAGFILIGYLLVEILSLTFIGLGLASMIEGLTDFHPEGFDHDLSIDHTEGLAEKAFSWLQIGRVPLSVLLVVFLTAFAATGLALQLGLYGLLGTCLPSSLAAAAVFPVALLLTRAVGRPLGDLLARSEGTLFKASDLVGLSGTVSTGTLTPVTAGTVFVRDANGQTRFVPAKSLHGPLPEGAAVVIAGYADPFYFCHPAEA